MLRFEICNACYALAGCAHAQTCPATVLHCKPHVHSSVGKRKRADSGGKNEIPFPKGTPPSAESQEVQWEQYLTNAKSEFIKQSKNQQQQKKIQHDGEQPRGVKVIDVDSGELPSREKMAIHNKKVVRNRHRTSLGHQDAGKVQKHVLFPHSMGGVEYLMSVAAGTAPAVFVRAGAKTKSRFHPPLGQVGETKNWYGIAIRADSQTNLAKKEKYNSSEQASNLLEFDKRGLNLLRAQNRDFDLLLLDIECRHRDLEIEWGALVRQAHGSSTRFGAHRDTTTPKRTTGKLRPPIRSLIVNLSQGGSGVRFFGPRKGDLGNFTYEKKGSCIDFCSDLWHESIESGNAGQVDLKFTAFLCSKL